MSKMAELDMYLQDVIKYVDDGEEIADAIAAVKAVWDLTDSEHRGLIHVTHQYYKEHGK